MHDAIRIAAKAAGGTAALARDLGISRQALHQWKRIPPLRVLTVERLTGVPRETLRPDLYPLASVADGVLPVPAPATLTGSKKGRRRTDGGIHSHHVRECITTSRRMGQP